LEATRVSEVAEESSPLLDAAAAPQDAVDARDEGPANAGRALGVLLSACRGWIAPTRGRIACILLS